MKLNSLFQTLIGMMLIAGATDYILDRAARASDLADEFGPSAVDPPEDVGTADEQPWRPSLADIKSIERKLVMPEGADPLNSYVRFYAGAWVDGELFIYGEFVAKKMANMGRPRGERGDIRIVKSQYDLPTWRDGGCSILRLGVIFERRTVSYFACNGEA